MEAVLEVDLERGSCYFAVVCVVDLAETVAGQAAAFGSEEEGEDFLRLHGLG
jgi:hypothetical protein